jgi:anti-anti-sigma factor
MAQPYPLHQHEAPVTIRLQGELDLNAVDELTHAIDAAIATPGCTEIVVDLEAVTFVDSTTIGVLVRGRQQPQQLGRDLFIAAPPEPVRRVLATVGVHDYLILPETLDATIAPPPPGTEV